MIIHNLNIIESIDIPFKTFQIQFFFKTILFPNNEVIETETFNKLYFL